MEDQNALVLRANLPADVHPALVYLASLARGSVPAQKSALGIIAEIMGQTTDTLDWGSLRYQHVQFIRARLAERYSATTANRILVALRRVMRESWKLGYMPEDDYRRVADVKKISVSKDDTEASLSGRALSMGEMAALMNVCAEDTTAAGARDAAIIALGFGIGLRREEVATLKIADYDRDASIIHVRSGKGNKARDLPIEVGVQDALSDWLSIRGDEPGAIFWGINKGGNIDTHQLNVKAINELYRKRARQAGLAPTDFHDLRRTFISELLDRGVDVATVAKLAGHSDPRVTLRYDRRTMETRRRAVQTLHVPYRRAARLVEV